MELIVKVNSFLNGIVMGWPGMILLVGTGVYYTIRCGGVQVVRLHNEDHHRQDL